jgi:hypothetical protein
MILVAPDLLLSVDLASSAVGARAVKDIATISLHRHTDPRLNNRFHIRQSRSTCRSWVFHRRTPIAGGWVHGLAHAQTCDLATRSYKL